MKHLKVIVIILFLLIVVVLAVQNYAALSTPISFKAHLFFFEHETAGMSVFMIAIITFLIGVIAVWVYGIGDRLSIKKEIKSLTKEVREKEKELNSLRNLPVTTEDMKPEEPSEIQN
jgi:uncharacterized integral membrane protein